MANNDVLWATSDSKRNSAANKHGFRKMYWAAGAALAFAVGLGMAAGYSASATADMKRASSPVRPDEDEITWIGSLLPLGALFGGLFGGYLSQKLGRKGALILTIIPFTIGWYFIMYGKLLAYIYAGRVITGICVGLICVTTPSYLVEISTPDVRGLLGTSFQLFIVIGVLLVNSFGAILTWEWLTVPSEGVLVLALCLMCLVPESPRWLIVKGKYQEAVSSVKFLQGDFLDASAECVAIDEDIRSQPKGAISLREFFRPANLIPALLSTGLVFFQQATGSNAILFYTVDIFKSASNSINANIATIIVDVVLVLATAVSSVLIDKVGRKILLMVSGAGMAVSLAVLGAYDYENATSDIFKNYGWIPLASIVVYIAAFSIGFGPIPWLMMAEMSPVKSRSLICGMATALCWFFVFVVTKTFEILELSIHYYGTYWLYAAFSVLSCIFVHFCLPETKGKSFDLIQEYFTTYRLANGRKRKYSEMS